MKLKEIKSFKILNYPYRRMGKREEMIFVLILSIMLVPGIFALNITISSSPSFSIGDNVSFNYTFSSDAAIQNGQYIIGVSCPSAPMPLLQFLNFNLQANQPLTKSYVYMSSLSDSIDPQTCTATISVINPVNYSQSIPLVLATNPSFNFNVRVCKDSNCSNHANIFVAGSKIYLRDYSNLLGININSVLTLPNGKRENLNFPADIIANQIGTYSLNVTASKQDYKTISQIVQFGVISEEPHIGYTSLAPKKQEGAGINKAPSDNLWKFILIIFIVAIFGIIAYFIFKSINHKKGKNGK